MKKDKIDEKGWRGRMRAREIRRKGNEEERDYIKE